MYDSTPPSETPSEIFHHKFFEFTQFQTKRPERIEISLLQVHRWCQMAAIFDDNFDPDTLSDLFDKFQRKTIPYDDFLLLVKEISVLKGVVYSSLQKTLADCKPPNYAEPLGNLKKSRSRSDARSHESIEEMRKLRRDRLVSNIMKKETLTNRLKTLELQEKLERLASEKQRSQGRQMLSVDVLDSQLRAHESKEEEELKTKRGRRKSVEVLSDAQMLENDEYLTNSGPKLDSKKETKNGMVQDEAYSTVVAKKKKSEEKLKKNHSKELKSEKASVDGKKKHVEEPVQVMQVLEMEEKPTEIKSKRKSRHEVDKIERAAEERRKSREHKIREKERKREPEEDEIERIERELVPGEDRTDSQLRRERVDRKLDEIERLRRESEDRKQALDSVKESRLRKKMTPKKQVEREFVQKSDEEVIKDNRDRDEAF